MIRRGHAILTLKNKVFLEIVLWYVLCLNCEQKCVTT